MPKQSLSEAEPLMRPSRATLPSRISSLKLRRVYLGSSWPWLSPNARRGSAIKASPNQDSPLTKGHQPVFGIDVWEHTYYLKYQNKRRLRGSVLQND